MNAAPPWGGPEGRGLKGGSMTKVIVNTVVGINHNELTFDDFIVAKDKFGDTVGFVMRNWNVSTNQKAATLYRSNGHFLGSSYYDSIQTLIENFPQFEFYVL